MVALEADTALVLLSAGQDSTTCLAWALDRFRRVETVGFEYGQRHGIEMELREPIRRRLAALDADWATRLGPDRVIDLAVLGRVSSSALTADLPLDRRPDGLPATFVPGRNLVFFTLAAIVAYQRGLKHVVGGMCETDFSGYPDCRDDTIKALQAAINLGMDTRLVLETPLMWIDKAATWRLAESLGGAALVELIRTETHSCYRGVRGTPHDWGHGCGDCDACTLRAKGWAGYAADRAAHGVAYRAPTLRHEQSPPIVQITDLWYSTDPQAWNDALERYWKFVKPANEKLERSLDELDLRRLQRFDPQGWYDFLKNEYFRWKYTASNRYATTTRQLRQYVDDDTLDNLDQIRKRLISLNPDDTRSALETAAAIRGLGTAGASGLLALMYPRNFGTVDQFVVKALGQVSGLPEAAAISDMNPESLTISDGVLLIDVLRKKAADNNRALRSDVWTPRKVEKVLWTYGR
jgi:7-cyano-7-deazaguanine synthase